MSKVTLLASLVSLGLPIAAQPAPMAAAADPEAGAILEAARVKGEAVQKARAAHIEAGGSSKTFQADLAGDLARMAARLPEKPRPPAGRL